MRWWWRAPRFWEMTMSSAFPEIGKCALPACSEGTAGSPEYHPPPAEGLRFPRGFPEWKEGPPRGQDKVGPRKGTEFRGPEQKARVKGCTQRQGAAARAAQGVLAGSWSLRG